MGKAKRNREKRRTEVETPLRHDATTIDGQELVSETGMVMDADLAQYLGYSPDNGRTPSGRWHWIAADNEDAP